MNRRKHYHILHEDDSIIIVEKAAGLSVIPDRIKDSISLLEILRKSRELVLPVHRIDRDTSGLIVYAKKENAHKVLNEQFREREVFKSYQCIIESKPENIEFSIEAPIFKPINGQKMKIHPKGKLSVSHVKIVDQTKQYSLAEVVIETGRTHQIRVHMQHVGHPILGDPLYNSHPLRYLSEFKKKFNIVRDKVERPIINRTALHAAKLRFLHPETNKPMEFTSEWPKDMRACWTLLKKYNA